MELYEIRKALMSGKTIYDLPLRVTYYARVSTGKNEQKNSLINQDDYYKNKILSIPKWTLVQGYSDSGITGTSIKKGRCPVLSENKRRRSSSTGFWGRIRQSARHIEIEA